MPNWEYYSSYMIVLLHLTNIEKWKTFAKEFIVCQKLILNWPLKDSLIKSERKYGARNGFLFSCPFNVNNKQKNINAISNIFSRTFSFLENLFDVELLYICSTRKAMDKLSIWWICRKEKFIQSWSEYLRITVLILSTVSWSLFPKKARIFCNLNNFLLFEKWSSCSESSHN